MGFNGELDANETASFLSHFPGEPPPLEGLHGIFKTQDVVKRRWWFEHGSGRSMTFALKDTDLTQTIFQEYLNEKGVVL